MLTIDQNSVAPLQALLEASIFPERATQKAQPLPRLQQDETHDAIHHRAVVWDQLGYEWAVDSGQAPLKGVINANKGFNAKTAGFYYALMEIEKHFGLEFSLPAEHVTCSTKRMKPWDEQRCALVERSDWIPLTILPTERNISVAKWNKSATLTRPVLPHSRVGQIWVRLSREAYGNIQKNMMGALKLLAELIRLRQDRLREILAEQKPNLTENEFALLNAHLNSAWESIVAMIPKKINQRARGRLTADEKNQVATNIVADLRRQVFQNETGMKAEKSRAKSGKGVFISYSHNDKRWLNKLVRMLAPLTRGNVIDAWYDEKIKPSQEWREEIRKAMESASIAVLLVTDNFLASDFIVGTEMPYFLKEAKKNEVTVVWVAVSPCLYKHTPLKDVQSANPPSKPLDSFKSTSAQKTALVAVCEFIAETAKANTAIKGESL